VLGPDRSPWVGWKNFQSFFGSYYFWDVLKNTFILSGMDILFGFPLAILLALLLNESPFKGYKKLVQSCSYLPYFVSAVAAVGMFKLFLSVDSGIINDLAELLTGKRYSFLTETKWFLWIYLLVNMWRWPGYDSIVYFSALSSIDPQLYEAAQIDGAGRLRRIWHVTLPGIRTTIILMFILRLGNIMNLAWQDVLLLQNDLNQEASEIIQTFVYKRGLLKADYSYATAVGLFQSLVGLVIILLANFASRKLTETSLF